MICFYHNDLDGKCAAAIVHNWVGIRATADGILLDPRFIPMNYAKPIPWDQITPNEQIWIVDFSFKPEDMHNLFCTTDDIVWIDHHKTVIDLYKNWHGHIRGIRRPDEAACVLTWKYVHWYTARGERDENFENGCPQGLEVPRAVAMIGDYDAWQHKIPDSTAFYEGCKLLDTTPGSDDWWNLLVCEAEGKYGDGTHIPKRDMCGPVIERGKACIQYRDAYCQDMCDSYGFETEIDGVRCWATNIYRFGSFGFGKRLGQYGMCAAYVFDGEKWTISLYSDTRDVSEIAKEHGGGGHKGAAGFVTKEFPFIKKVVN